MIARPYRRDSPIPLSNVVTGEVAAGSCGGGQCAEDVVVDKMGGNADDVRFTSAIRPRTGEQVPVCLDCEAAYGRQSFAPGTIFKSDLGRNGL